MNYLFKSLLKARITTALMLGKVFRLSMPLLARLWKQLRQFLLLSHGNISLILHKVLLIFNIGTMLASKERNFIQIEVFHYFIFLFFLCPNAKFFRLLKPFWSLLDARGSRWLILRRWAFDYIGRRWSGQAWRRVALHNGHCVSHSINFVFTAAGEGPFRRRIHVILFLASQDLLL